jgi:hypothetical protein
LALFQLIHQKEFCLSSNDKLAAHRIMSKQTHLSFTPITADEAAKQRAALAAVFAAEYPAAAAADVPEKRGVGRPKRRLDLALVAQQSNNNNNNNNNDDDDNNDNAKRTRGTYTNWFTSPYINDIIAMYNRKHHSARIAVAALRASAPDGRFDRLSHSTIAEWFDANHKLKITYAAQLSLKQGAARGHGPPAALKALPNHLVWQSSNPMCCNGAFPAGQLFEQGNQMYCTDGKCVVLICMM